MNTVEFNYALIILEIEREVADIGLIAPIRNVQVMIR